MAVINVRVEDSLRDALVRGAEDQGESLSEHIRMILLEAVAPVREVDGNGYRPDSLSAAQRQTFALLHRILARVLPEGSNDVDGNAEDQLDLAATLEHGYTAEYWRTFAGVQPELSLRDCSRVMDILDMFRIIDYSIEKLRRDGVTVAEELVESLSYSGFDFNDDLEGRMADYVNYLLDHGKWQERRSSIEENDGGNSHAEMLPVYLRMLAEYRRAKESHRRGGRWDWALSLSELEQIADVRSHPASRTRQWTKEP